MFTSDIKFKYSWRPYQAKVLEEIEKYINDGKINIVAAPGSGKTVLGLELARRLGKAVLILSPTVTIKNQWIDRFVTSFMPENSTKPSWISDNIYDLSFFNSVTYQALHYAYKRKKILNKLEDTDDEIIEEEEKIDELKIETYDLIKEIKKNKITTIVLDEAHHLKSEWWKSLTSVINSLDNITLISLTATPPYDIEYGEWEKYESLCGSIDVEISVPELVAAKNLCPHQDYIYYSYPTENEKIAISEYRKKINDFIKYLQSNNDFINMLSNHPYITKTDTDYYIEQILDNTEFYSSMLIFLKSVNFQLDKRLVRVLGHNKPIPNLTNEWVEILLKNILFNPDEYVIKYETLIEEIKKELNKIGAIDNKNIYITTNSSIQKLFSNSISKLESINKIVEAEYNNLKQDLRMVILTDYIRKEYLEDANIEFNKIGVFSIFQNLIRKIPNIKIGILTGSIFMIPEVLKEKLLESAIDFDIPNNDIEFENKVPNYAFESKAPNYVFGSKASNYVIVKSSLKNKNKLMNLISNLFSKGDINIMIGTKALLGEGWDEPSINSLILASFVGSFVLSNQMRGRAIRVNDNPYKTANIWHLACVYEKGDNPDFDTMERRFKAFEGISYNSPLIENGISRLDIVPENFSKSALDKYDEKILELSNKRTEMYNRWFEIVSKYGGTNINLRNQLNVSSSVIKNKFSVFEVFKVVQLILIFMVVIFFLPAGILSILAILNEIFTKNLTILEGLVNLIPILLYTVPLMYSLWYVYKYTVLAIPSKLIKTVAIIVTKSLCEARFVKTNFNDIKINTERSYIYNGYDEGYTYLQDISIDGVTVHENNLILNSIKEMFTKIDNQRYLLVNKPENRFYVVPSLLGQNKENAEIFQANWKKYIGKTKLIYTKSINGRKILLKARKNSFTYLEDEDYQEIRKPLSNWR